MRSPWLIEDRGEGTFDVFKDRRIVAYDLGLGEALSLVRRGGGKSYDMVEADGYRSTHRV